MKYLLAILVLAALALALAYWLSPLHTFNFLVPKDGGSRKLAEGMAYDDHPRQQLDIYAPEGGGENLPVIVFFYGGSWASGTREGYDFAGRALAAQGFLVVVPDYRLVPEVRYPGFIEDGAQAVRWVRANIAAHGGDADRIVLSGHSAGAYIAAMLAYDARWLGEERDWLRGFAGLAGPYDFLPLDVDSTREAFGRWPRLEETQPVTWVDGSGPPALLLTGTQDITVRPRNSLSLAGRLEAAGGEAEVVQYADTDHSDIVIALSRPLRHRTPALADMIAFSREVTAD